MRAAFSRLPKMKRIGLVVIAVLVIAACVISFTHARYSLSYMREGAVNYTAAESYWQRRIQNQGVDHARAEFLTQGDVLSIPQAHVLAHAFGEALFDTTGVSGIRGCGNEFLHGCYHQFIGTAVATLGLTVVPQIYQSCLTVGDGWDVFGCKHGIGHALIAYYGYTPDALEQTLEKCSSLDPATPRSGCLDGAFMEYNLRILANISVSGDYMPRTLTAENVSSVCDSVNGTYRSACVYELPYWWMLALPSSMNTEQRFTRIGHYCDDLSAQHSGDAQPCFEFTGRLAAVLSDYDTGQTKSYCTLAASDTRKMLFCLSKAASIYNSTKEPALSDVCSKFGLTDDALTYCSAIALSGPESTTTVAVPAL